jgi:iron complex transport system substrate-binding protein
MSITTPTSAVRLVSLLPSATEMACALGLGENLVAITHCCDYPPEILTKPRIVKSALPAEALGLREIDEAVTNHLKAGASLYHVDELLLQQLAPTHILTQDLCQVCAPSGNEITRALKALSHPPQVLWMSPHSIAEIHQNILELGLATGRETEARNLVASNLNRLERVSNQVASSKHKPRVFCAEWLDPLFCSGHWVPELVEIAGGDEPLGRKWSDSIRISWESVLESQPEVIVLMLCGFNRETALEHAEWLVRQTGFHELPAAKRNQVFAVDAGYFSRPGPRVIEGAELLAHLLHPDLCEWLGPETAFSRVPIQPMPTPFPPP